MIRIAHIVTPITFGGSEKVNLNYLRNADRGRFDICGVVLVRPWEGETIFIKELKRMNYTFFNIPVAKGPSGTRRNYLRVIKSCGMLYAISKRGRFNLIHTHGYFSDIIGMPVSKILNIPHISTCHGFISNDRNLKIYNALDRFALRFCNKIIAVSDEIKNDLLNAGIRESKIVVIQNAVQNSYERKEFEENRTKKRKLLSIEESDFVVGYVGRLSEEKGLHYLIEAAMILKEKDKKFKVIVIGDGPKRKDLEDFTRRRCLEKEVIFTGFQNDVEEWFPAFDAFVLPSLTEGTPMALLEAMSAGIPPIASAVGGVPKVVEDGVNGFLVAPGDFWAISEKVIALKKNPELQKKMVSEAVNLIKNRFDVHDWCRKIEAEYDFLLTG